MSGRVTDASGAPIAGVCVKVLSGSDPNGPSRTVSTGSDGTYVAADLPGGRYYVQFNCARDARYLLEYYDNIFVRANSTILELGAGQALTDVDAELGPGGSVSGRVTGPDGAGVGGVYVRIAADQESGAAEATTADDGTYRLEHVAPGAWGVGFTTGLYDAPSKALLGQPFVGNGQPGDPPTLVPVTDSQDTSGVDVHLVEGGRLMGRVTDSVSGNPVAGCRIDPYSAGWNNPGYAFDHLTDSAGNYELIAEPTIDVMLRIGECTDPYYLTQFHGDLNNPASLVHLQVGQTTAQDVSLARGGTLTGRVVDADSGAPLDNCLFASRDTTATVDGYGSTGAGNGGRFSTTPSPPGPHAASIFGCHDPHERLDIVGGLNVIAGTTTDVGDIAVRRAPAPGQPRDLTSACPRYNTPTAPFNDIDAASPHAPGIDCAASWGLIQGSNGSFQPAEPVTRGQVASLMIRLIQQTGGPIPPSPRDWFSDDNGSVHEAAINALTTLGVFHGLADGTAGADNPVNRAQYARLIVGAIEYQREIPVAATRDWFNDDNGSIFEAAINGLAQEGVLLGTSPGSFNPNSPLRRDQAASVLARALDAITDAGLTWPPTHNPR